MLVVHHLGVSQSERIVWLCEELGLDYELKIYQRDPVTRLAPPEYKALHPIGAAPVITDNGRTLAESGAIVQYLIARYGNGALSVPPEAPNFADYLYWFHFVNATLLPNEMIGLFTSAVGAPSDTPIATMLKARADNGFALIEQRLGETDYLAGDALTGADIMMVFGLTTMHQFVPRDLSAAPNTRAYLARIAERPAYRKAMQAG